MEYRFDRLTAQEYNALRRAVGWTEEPLPQAGETLRQSVNLCAVEKGRVVGMGRLVRDEAGCILADVVVHPIYQGCSVGRNIVLRLLEYAQQQAPAGSCVTVRFAAAPGKEGFLRCCGFQRQTDAEGRKELCRVLTGTGQKQTPSKSRGPAADNANV